MAALVAGRPALVWRRRIADTETPVAAALKLIEPGRGDFLLESVEGGAVRGRHTMIGLAPDLVLRARGDRAELNARWLEDRDAFAPVAAPTLAALRDLVRRGDPGGTAVRVRVAMVARLGNDPEARLLVERVAAPPA